AMRFSICVILLAGAAAACSADHSGPADSTGGTIVIAEGSDAGDLLPPLVGDITGRAVSDLLFDRLAEISPGLTTGPADKGFTPRLAQHWTWAPDSLSIAFAIDPRARWHDGRPVRASDVRFSYRLAVDPKLASQ